MIKKFLKGNKGISIMDVGIALTLFALFAGLVGNLYYQIAFNNTRVRYDGLATYNVVRIAEYIDEKSYEDITNEKIDEFKSTLNCPEALTITTTVTNYTGENSPYIAENEEIKDLVKLVNIEAAYEIGGKDYSFNIEKLKIKEPER